MKPARITRVRAVKGGKFEIEVTQSIEKTGTRPNLTSLLNKGDDRFTQAKERKAWKTGEAAMLKEYFGIDCNLAKDAPIEVNILNPKMDGYPLNIEIKESNTPTAFQALNVLKSAKQYTDKDGNVVYLRNEKGLIFVNADVVAGDPNHTFIQHSATVSAEEVAALVEEAQAAAVVVEA